MGDTLRVALVTEVFYEDQDGAALDAMVVRAKEQGADLVVLPELPLNPWSPASKTQLPADEERPAGPRARRLSAVAAQHSVGLLGGAIIRDPGSGKRHNTALLYGPGGELVDSYRKVHLPNEEGFWESAHYEPGDGAPGVSQLLGWAVGLQICSDINRPVGTQLLASQGAALILVPRATPEGTYDRWRLVLRAQAVMSGAYLISVNRPGPEAGVAIGAATVAIAPDGKMLAETTEPLVVVELDPAVVSFAASEYPGYLSRPADLYARAWSELAE